MDFKFLKQALGGYWLISESGAQFYAELLHRVLEANNDKQEITAGMFDDAESPYRANSKGTKTQNGNVFVLPIEGALMKADYCGSMGTDSMSNLLQMAYKDNSIEGIVLKVNSPGGNIQGIENLSNTVAAKNKPVVAWGELMASAAYWASVNATEIMTAGETGMIGSIGTMATLRDSKARNEKYGYKEIVLYASRSVHKNKSHQDAIDGKPEAFIAEMLDPLNAAFENDVLQARGNKIDLKKEDPLTGKIYIGSTAIKNGLADSKGSLTDAIKRSIQLAKSLS